jgi:SOS-response transcriptional repressor LexA
MAVLRDLAEAPETIKPVATHRTGTRFVPVYAGLSAGVPGDHHGDVEWVELMDWGTDFERWGRRIEGFSMEPLIHPGDIIVFENRRAEHSHVVHAYKDGEDGCKVIWGHGPSASLRPVNPDYEPLPIEGWSVKGVAVLLIRRGPDGERISIEYPYGLRHKFYPQS